MSSGGRLLHGKRCLVLDDEVLIALDIQNILEGAGAAEVICVGNADDAAKALNGGGAFDLAVLDVRLGGATGTSLGIAGLLTRQKTPFVFLTGLRQDGAFRSEFPAAPVVDKPYDTALLIAAVRTALDVRNR
jgi:CheY-like chemotaxis protein